MPDAGALQDLRGFRARARQWIAANLEPLDGADSFMGHASDDADQVVRAKAIQRRLWDGGFAGLCYPADYGGRGRPPADRQSFHDEASFYYLPRLFTPPPLPSTPPPIPLVGTRSTGLRPTTHLTL